jgi:tRNA A-37 threonylcarbamoyl transferase component Bud32
MVCKAKRFTVGQDRVSFSAKGANVICCRSVYPELKQLYEQHHWIYDYCFTKPEMTIIRGRKPVLMSSIGGIDCIVKRHYHGGLLAGVTQNLFWGKARLLNALKTADYLSENNIDTPSYIFVTWRKSLIWSQYESATVCYHDGRDAAEYLFSSSESKQSNRDLLSVARKIGVFIKNLHKANFFHRDLNLMNIYIKNDSRTAVLDLDKCSPPKSHLSCKAKKRNLNRLVRSVRKIGRTHPPQYVESIVCALRQGYEEV